MRSAGPGSRRKIELIRTVLWAYKMWVGFIYESIELMDGRVESPYILMISFRFSAARCSSTLLDFNSSQHNQIFSLNLGLFLQIMSFAFGVQRKDVPHRKMASVASDGFLGPQEINEILHKIYLNLSIFC